MHTVLARKKNNGPAHAPRAATTYIACAKAKPDKDGMWRVFTADGEKRKVHPDTLEDWFRMRCEINWEDSAMDIHQNNRKYRGRLPTPNNPLVQLGGTCLSKTQLGNDNFVKAAFLPMRYVDAHTKSLSSRNVEEMRTFLSLLRFDAEALRDLKFFRDIYFNLTSAITSEQYAIDCETAKENLGRRMGDGNITQQDINALCTDTKSYLSDDIMNTIAQHLVGNFKTVVLLSSMTIPALRIQNGADQAKKKIGRMRKQTLKNLKIQLAAVDIVVGFLHINGNHWVAYAIDKELKQFLYIDSKGGRLSPENEQSLDYIKVAFFPEATFATITNTITSQDDNWTCGLHAIWAMYVFANKLHHKLDPAYFIVPVPEDTMKSARRWVLQKMLEIANVV